MAKRLISRHSDERGRAEPAPVPAIVPELNRRQQEARQQAGKSNMRQSITGCFIPVVSGPDGSRLACPACGDSYVHPIGISCLPAGEAGGCLSIDAKGVRWDHQQGVSGRGVLVELKFACEQGHAFTFWFQFHKGETFLQGQFGEAPEGFRTIWRD